MSIPVESNARGPNKTKYEFLCFCDQCRKSGWRDRRVGDIEPLWPDDLPEAQRRVPGENPRYLAYRTSQYHLKEAKVRRGKRGKEYVQDPYETLWLELANHPRFFAQTFGGSAFAKSGRAVLPRAKRGRDGDGDEGDGARGARARDGGTETEEAKKGSKGSMASAETAAATRKSDRTTKGKHTKHGDFHVAWRKK